MYKNTKEELEGQVGVSGLEVTCCTAVWLKTVIATSKITTPVGEIVLLHVSLVAFSLCFLSVFCLLLLRNGVRNA